MHLENGQLERFGMSIKDSDKVVFLDKDDNWSYEFYGNNSSIKISSDISENKTSCNVSIDNSNNVDSIQKLISDNMNDAREDVEKVKVRIRNLFDEEKLKYWENIYSN